MMTKQQALQVVRTVCERGSYNSLAEARVTEQALAVLALEMGVDAKAEQAEKGGRHAVQKDGEKHVPLPERA